MFLFCIRYTQESAKRCVNLIFEAEFWLTGNAATFFDFNIFVKFLLIFVSYAKGNQEKNDLQNLTLFPSIAYS